MENSIKIPFAVGIEASIFFYFFWQIIIHLDIIVKQSNFKFNLAYFYFTKNWDQILSIIEISIKFGQRRDGSDW